MWWSMHKCVRVLQDGGGADVWVGACMNVCIVSVHVLTKENKKKEKTNEQDKKIGGMCAHDLIQTSLL